MQIVPHFPAEPYPFLLACLRHLISEGIHNDRRMAVIFLHHCFQVFPVILFYFSRIVMHCLMDVPYVYVFIHDQHTLSVAGVQKSFRARIVGASYSVIPGFFQNAHFPRLRVSVSAGAEYSVIVVRAGAS